MPIATKPLRGSAVFDSMMRTDILIEREDPRGGYVVRRPRETDATGEALRHAFGGNAMLPRDMVALLERMERGTRN